MLATSTQNGCGKHALVSLRKERLDTSTRLKYAASRNEIVQQVQLDDFDVDLPHHDVRQRFACCLLNRCYNQGHPFVGYVCNAKTSPASSGVAMPKWLTLSHPAIPAKIHSHPQLYHQTLLSNENRALH